MDADDVKNLQCFLRSKKKAEAKNKLSEVAEFCNCIGEIYSKYGQYEEAIQEHTQELHLSEALGDKIGEAVACRKIGECHCFLGQYEEALSLQKRHLVLARECGNNLEEQRAWATIGKTYFCQSESRNLMTSAAASKKAEKAYTKALEVCEKIKSSVKVEEYMAMKGRLYLNIGLVYDTRGEVRLCTDVMKRAVAIAEKFKLQDEKYMCHSSLANMYQKSGQSTQALRAVDLALKMAEKLRNKVGEKEMFIQKAQILVSVGDYLAAKHALKKAYKIKVLSDTGEDKLVKMFRCVNKMQEASLDLETNTDERKIAEQRETLADCSAELGNFSEAVEHYLATLQSKDLLSSEKRAEIYVSLAQTYADLRNYEEAIFYYQQELEERKENQEQSCRTLLNIAELEELKGSKYSVMCKIYMSAFEAARKAKHLKLQVQTLKSLTALQKACKQSEHLRETEKKLESLVKKNRINAEQLGSSSGDEEDLSSDKDDSDDEDNADVAKGGKGCSNVNDDGNLSLSDLTLSDDESDDDTTDLAAAPTRPKKTKLARRNEKGETPLHRACIEGNLKRAKTLISQGHPINPRDFCGWLPLHEACNHGHTELVRCLLDAGAWINDRGGERCGGVTPLIDAANCGNLAIVRLLVERGANLHAKDDDGNTASDCLHAWYQRAGDTMGASDVLEYTATERMLQDRGGPAIKPSGSSSTKTGHNSDQAASSSSGASFKERLSVLRQKKMNRTASPQQRRNKPQREAQNLSSDDELSDCDLVPYSLPKSNLETKSGASEYRSAIDFIGSSVQKRLESQQGHEEQKEADESIASASLPALLDEREDVGDNWLINDVNTVKPKRKSSHLASLFTTSSTRPPGKRRTAVEEKAAAKRSRLSVMRSKLSRVENLPSISSSEDVLTRETPENLVTVSSGRRKNALSHPELFEDQSSGDACPVTSSTERVDTSRPTQQPQRDQNAGLDDEWDSDDELLSHMDNMDESLGGGDYSLSLGHLNTSVVSDWPPTNESLTSEDHLNDRQNLASSFRNRLQSSPRREQQKTSKSSFTLDTLLSDKNNSSKPHEFHHTGDNSIKLSRPQKEQKKDSVVLVASSISHLQEQPSQHHHHHHQHTSPSLPVESPVVTTSLRVKVKIGEQTMLIPIQSTDQQRTILWLCQQAAQRYFNMFLVRPLLALNTSDGSVLSPTDTIASVLADHDVLTAVVRSWERPKLGERYRQACTLCLLEENKSVVASLRACDSSGVLNLCDLGLSSSLLQPVFQAVDSQRTLTELLLTGNRLGDLGVVSLMELLAGLPILKVLSLDSNGLSVEGVRTMAAVLKQKSASSDYGTHHCLSALTSLSLGHNSLEDFAAPALAAVVDLLPRLIRLDLPACGFTEAVFTPDFCSALQGRKLKHLSMPENQLNSEGISLLLNSLHAECLQSLDISHTRTGTDKHLLPMLENFATGECCLADLSLAGCHLTDSDVIAVNRLVVTLKSLTRLSLSQNKNVTNKSLQKLLALSTGGVCSLESLTARGCSVTSPLGAELLEALKGKLCSGVPLVKLVFSCRGLKRDEENDVKAVWTGRWRERAQCKILGVAVSLTVAEDR